MTRMATVKVSILGIEFSFKTDDPGSIKELAAYVDAEIQKVLDGGKVSSQTKAVILAAFTIANELFQLREEKENLSQRLDGLLDMAKQIQAPPPAE